MNVLALPYGVWGTKDKEIILFNRKYQPMFVWSKGVVTEEDPNRRVNYCSQRWFYSGMEIASQVLAVWYCASKSSKVKKRSLLLHLLRGRSSPTR